MAFLENYLCQKILSLRFTISFLLLVLFYSCQINYKKSSLVRFKQDSTAVNTFIHKGDSIYSQKADYGTFYKSLALYDSAYQIAINSSDTFLIAQTIFAKGRAYDAINNNPQKTIDYYTEAANLYATIPNMQVAALYIKHLVAHSYDKVNDSSNCIKILKELYNNIILKPDSIKKQLHFTAEMALISTVIKNYGFADSILKNLTKRDWIKNNTTEYDYLNHYYLTQARIEVYLNRNAFTNYFDSIKQVLNQSKNLNDSVYYSGELMALNKAIGNKKQEAYYLQINTKALNQFNSPQKVREVQDKLGKMEVAAVEEKRKAETEKAQSRKLIIYLLSALLLAIILFAVFLNKKNRQAKFINQQLQQKNQQNELLNKEIHHRVKNNLEMIMSLVYMQQRNTDTEEVKENMQNISLRIESIANLHHQLMEQADEVDLKKYIQNLVGNVTNILSDNKNVLTYLEVQPLIIPQKISFPLGLIINEWITNSVKYAIPSNHPLKIFIEICNGNNEIKVKYWDNGEPKTTLPNIKSLGLDIVALLTAQLNATAIKNEENLFSYHLIIPN